MSKKSYNQARIFSFVIYWFFVVVNILIIVDLVPKRFASVDSGYSILGSAVFFFITFLTVAISDQRGKLFSRVVLSVLSVALVGFIVFFLVTGTWFERVVFSLIMIAAIAANIYMIKDEGPERVKSGTQWDERIPKSK